MDVRDDCDAHGLSAAARNLSGARRWLGGRRLPPVGRDEACPAGPPHLRAAHARLLHRAACCARGARYERSSGSSSLLATVATVVVFVLYARCGHALHCATRRPGRSAPGCCSRCSASRSSGSSGCRSRSSRSGGTAGTTSRTRATGEVIFGGWLALGVEFIVPLRGRARRDGLRAARRRPLVDPRRGVLRRPLRAVHLHLVRTSSPRTHSLRSDKPALAEAGCRPLAQEGGRRAASPSACRTCTATRARRTRSRSASARHARSSSGTRSSTAASRAARSTSCSRTSSATRRGSTCSRGSRWYALFTLPGAYLIARSRPGGAAGCGARRRSRSRCSSSSC